MIEKDIKRMGLGELVESIISLTVEKAIALYDLNNSPQMHIYEQGMKKDIIDKYNKKIKPLKEELNRREKWLH